MLRKPPCFPTDFAPEAAEGLVPVLPTVFAPAAAGDAEGIGAAFGFGAEGIGAGGVCPEAAFTGGCLGRDMATRPEAVSRAPCTP